MALTSKFIQNLHQQFEENLNKKILQNAVTSCNVLDFLRNWSIINTTQHTFSNKLPDVPITNQKSSGRCWIFASLNMLRHQAMNKLNVEGFEFSQNFSAFYDKFERANFFLEKMIEMVDKSPDDRVVSFLLSRPLDDGGQWTMFAQICNKYGLCPKELMQETITSSSSYQVNKVVCTKLRYSAKILRDLYKETKSVEELRKKKEEILKEIWNILCIHLGTPPQLLTYEYYDKEKKFNKMANITPIEFMEKTLEHKLEDYVCLVNDPRETSGYNKMLTIEHLGNVHGGDIVRYLNVEIDVMLECIRKAIVEQKEPVWFGSDVSPQFDRANGIFDEKMFLIDEFYGSDIIGKFEKADRLIFGQSAMTHAMVFCGVDVDDNGKIQKLKVENSWGDQTQQKGFSTMNVNWFKHHVYEVAIRKDLLPKELLDVLKQDPKVLPVYDPLGNLAKVL
ncbi:bleomycin hydrolase [Anaeramoeba ignava]|uniref:bleomycin hydrolase n=1 Tax=Anaeramoeba ignava TaxID=1746090 RepID=A0A9Q0R9G7_ANAIG|nr:bleomycin hydrolase [Anaeramoeba ignava]